MDPKLRKAFLYLALPVMAGFYYDYKATACVILLLLTVAGLMTLFDYACDPSKEEKTRSWNPPTGGGYQPTPPKPTPPPAPPKPKSSKLNLVPWPKPPKKDK